MKKLTLQFLIIALAIIGLSVVETSAQKRVNFDEDGKAKIKVTVKAKGKTSLTISGKDFGKLSIKQTSGGDLNYELRRGSEFASSGHATGSNIKVTSDGSSTYTFTLINNSDKVVNADFYIVTQDLQELVTFTFIRKFSIKLQKEKNRLIPAFS